MSVLRKLVRRSIQKVSRSFLPSNSEPEATVALLHIPKTGGTYLNQHESPNKSVLGNIRNFGHAMIVESEDKTTHMFPPSGLGGEIRPLIPFSEAQKYLVVSTVRNVFSWLVSYADHAGGWTKRYANKAHYDFPIVQKGFDYLVKTLSDREENLWPSRKFIHCQLFTERGRFVPNWLFRQESLDADAGALANYLGWTYSPAAPQRVGRHQDYRKYYSDTLIELVRSTWGRELDLFGYDFDGPMPGRNEFYQQIDESVQDSVRYVWETDNFQWTCMNGRAAA